MIRRLALAWAALGALAWAAPADGQIISDPRPLPDRTALGRIGLERAWFSAVPLRGGVEQVIHLSLTSDGKQVFAQTNEARLYCFDAETGRLIWTAGLGGPSGHAQDVGSNESLVFATNGNFVYSLDRATGREIWVDRMEANASAPVEATDDLVLIGLSNGKLLALSHEQPSDPRFRRESGAPSGFAWNFSTNGPITARPIPTQFVVAFASNGGKLYVSQLDPPEILHRSQPLGELYASMGTYGTGPESLLVVPSMNGNVYGINLFTGQQQWVFPTGAPVDAEPLVGGGDVTVVRRVPDRRTRTIIGTDLKPYEQEFTVVVEQQETIPMPPTVYVLNSSGELFAIDPESGESRWTRTVSVPGSEQIVLDPKTGRQTVVPGSARLMLDPETGEPAKTAMSVQTGAEQILALSPSRIYLRTLYGDLSVVERETGDLIIGPSATYHRAGVDLRSYSLTTTNDVNDRIYLASPFGSIICLREVGATEPIPLRAPAERPFGFLRALNDSETQTPPSVPLPTENNAPEPPRSDPGGPAEVPFGEPSDSAPPEEGEPADNPFEFGFNSRPLAPADSRN